MTDLAAHELPVAVLQHWSDPNWNIPGVYGLNWGHPNQLFYLLALPLAYLVGSTWACKLVVFCSIAALPPSLERLARFASAPRLMSVTLASMAYGFTFFWGLAPNLTAIPIFFYAVPDLYSHTQRPSAKSVVLASGLLLLLYEAHQSVMLAGGAVLCVGILMARPILDRWWLKVLPGALTLLVTFLQQRIVRGLRPPSIVSHAMQFDPLDVRIAEVPRILFGHHGAAPEAVLFITFLLALSFAAASPRSHDAGLTQRRYFLAAVGTLLLVAYVCAPSILWGATMLHQRNLPLAAVLLAMALTAGVEFLTVLQRVVAAVPLAASTLMSAGAFVGFHEDSVALDRMTDGMPPDSSILMLAVGASSVRPALIQESCGRLVARRGGRCAYDITSSPISPVLRTPDASWDAPIARLIASDNGFFPASDLRIYRYFIAYVYDPNAVDATKSTLAPDARLLRQDGPWMLFESRYDTLPLGTPNDRLPAPSGIPLKARLVDHVRRLPSDSRDIVREALSIKTNEIDRGNE